MPTRSISTQQTQQQLDGTHFLKVAAFPVKILSLEGYCGGASSGGQKYIQLYAGIPTNGAVPLWSQQVLTQNGFSFVYAPEGLDTATMVLDLTYGNSVPTTKAIYVAISSDDTQYTSDGTTTDIRVDFEEYELELTGQTTIGTGSSVGLLQVWTDASGPKKLLSVTAQNNNGATQYLMLFAKDAVPATGDSPIVTWTFTAALAATLRFGACFVPRQQDTDGTFHDGCTLRVSSTSPTFTAVASGWTIQATFI